MTTPTPNVTPGKAGGAAALVLASVFLMNFLGVWEEGAQRQLVVYADKLARNLPTVCAGITRHVTTTPIIVGQRWTEAQCLAEERKAVIVLQTGLLKCFKLTPPQSVFDAATSHAWNNGLSATCGSAAMRSWNDGDWPTGCRRMVRSDSGRPVWSYVWTGKYLPNGKREMKFVQGLANRRQAEYEHCMKGAI